MKVLKGNEGLLSSPALMEALQEIKQTKTNKTNIYLITIKVSQSPFCCGAKSFWGPKLHFAVASLCSIADVEPTED